jgi:fatty-acyl-CoA synthase
VDTVVELIEGFAADAPNSTAVIYRGESISAAELAERSRRVAAGLNALGIGEGDRIALWLPNAPAYLILSLACARIGAITVAVNTRFRSAEVADIVGRSGSKMMVMWPGFKGIDFPAILGEVQKAALPALETVVLYDEGEGGTSDLSWPTVPYSQLEAHEPVSANKATPNTPCNIFTTSGTTRAPKFVLHRQFAITRHGEQVAVAFGYDRPATVLLQALPLGGVFGYAQAMATLAARAPMVMMPTFDAAEGVDLVRTHKVTDFNGSDDMVHRMLEAAPEVKFGAKPFPSLRAVGFAGFNSALEDLPDRAEARGLTLVGLYGMSEVQALFARQPVDAPLEQRRLAGGRLTAPGGEVRAREPETGQLLPHGEPGELEFRGPSLMVGYFHNAEATGEAFTQDGFFRSGDLGYTVARERGGGFVFLSRMGDVLRLGGYLVSPAEIEGHIQDHASVAGAQVVAAPTPQGNRAVAFVVVEAGADLDEAALMDHCRAGLARFKVPVRFVAVEAFPTTMSPNGVKIQRNKLRDMAIAVLNEEDS